MGDYTKNPPSDLDDAKALGMLKGLRDSYSDFAILTDDDCTQMVKSMSILEFKPEEKIAAKAAGAKVCSIVLSGTFGDGGCHKQGEMLGAAGVFNPSISTDIACHSEGVLAIVPHKELEQSQAFPFPLLMKLYKLIGNAAMQASNQQQSDDTLSKPMSSRRNSASLQSAEASIAEMKKQITKEKTAKKRAETLLAECKEKLATTQGTLEEKTKLLAETEEKLSKKSSELYDKNQELSQKVADCTSANDKVKACEDEHEKLLTQVEAQKSLVAEKEKELAAEKANTAKCKEELKEMENKSRDSINAELSKFEEAKQSLQNKIEEIQAAVAVEVQEKEALTKSLEEVKAELEQEKVDHQNTKDSAAKEMESLGNREATVVTEMIQVRANMDEMKQESLEREREHKTQKELMEKAVWKFTESKSDLKRLFNAFKFFTCSVAAKRFKTRKILVKLYKEVAEMTVCLLKEKSSSTEAASQQLSVANIERERKKRLQSMALKGPLTILKILEDETHTLKEHFNDVMRMTVEWRNTSDSMADRSIQLARDLIHHQKTKVQAMDHVKRLEDELQSKEEQIRQLEMKNNRAVTKTKQATKELEKEKKLRRNHANKVITSGIQEGSHLPIDPVLKALPLSKSLPLLSLSAESGMAPPALYNHMIRSVDPNYDIMMLESSRMAGSAAFQSSRGPTTLKVESLMNGRRPLSAVKVKGSPKKGVKVDPSWQPKKNGENKEDDSLTPGYSKKSNKSPKRKTAGSKKSKKGKAQTPTQLAASSKYNRDGLVGNFVGNFATTSALGFETYDVNEDLKS
mmetsp:Transcript_40269/g.79145  ORF Transcript_40269/g.79145 Transcript_40269/m.79145 type:complete len:802 (-) Transcript_40269:111-2516(-)